MKALVVYDSVFGNTAKVAQAIGGALGGAGEVATKQVAEVRPEDLVGLALLVVGSPTRAFRPTPAMVAWLKGLPAGRLHGVKVAAFDTRIDPEDTKSGFLRFMVKLFGYAAEPISKRLVKKGATVAMSPQGFFVVGTEGPLKDGELERAAEWGRKIAA
jgi:flavodoxin